MGMTGREFALLGEGGIVCGYGGHRNSTLPNHHDQHCLLAHMYASANPRIA
jgi:hypothetical protein